MRTALAGAALVGAALVVAACAAKTRESTPATTPVDAADAPARGYRAVPLFVLDHEKVAGDMPRLPDSARRRPANGGELRGSYMMYVGTAGRVERIDVVTSIPNADDVIVAQLRTWRFKQQSVPLRSLVSFVYTVP